MKITPTTTDLEVVSSYVEDDKELNVLVPTKVSPDDKIKIMFDWMKETEKETECQRLANTNGHKEVGINQI